MDEYNKIVEENAKLPDGEKKVFDINKLGNGIKFYGYNDENGNLDLSQAFTKHSFLFDGVDDYLEFPFEGDNAFDGGFSLEFYGKFYSDGKHINIATGQETGNAGGYAGIMNGIRSKVLEKENWYDLNYGGLRFGFYLTNGDSDSIGFNFIDGSGDWVKLCASGTVDKGWSVSAFPWNQRVNVRIDDGEVIHLMVVFDGENGEEKLFLNGSKISNAKISPAYWNEYVEKSKDLEDGFGKVDKLWFGRMRSFHYSHMECYSCKLYGRALTDAESEDTYKKSVSYHEFLED